MKYWLLKSEPDVFSIDDLKKNKKEIWSGVRNYQARNFMRDGMSVGDLCFFYHSSCEVPAIVGLCEISKTRVVDPTQFDTESEYYDPKSKKENPTWICVEVKFLKKFPNPLTLSEIKKNKKLSKMRLVQPGSRLSVQPVSLQEYSEILRMI